MKEDRIEEVFYSVAEGIGIAGSWFVAGSYRRGPAVVMKDDCHLVASVRVETDVRPADRSGTCLDCGDKVSAGNLTSTVMEVGQETTLSPEEEAGLEEILKDLARPGRWRSKCHCSKK